MVSDDIRSFLSRTPVLFVLLATLWGGSFVAIEVGLHYFPPLVFAGLRYLVAGAILLGYAVLAVDRWRPASRAELLSIGLVGAFFIAGHHAFIYLGEQYVSGAIAAIVISLSPILTAGFAAVVLGERLTLGKGVGFALGIAGVTVLADFDPTSALSASAAGVGLVFLAAACFALGAVLVRPIQTDLPIPSMQGWGMVSGSAALLAVGLARGESLGSIAWTPTAFASLAYLTLLSGVVGFIVYFALLDRIGPTQLNLIGYFEPVAAALLGWLLLGDLIGVETVLGFAIIFAGFALVERRAVFDVAKSVVASDEREDGASEWTERRDVGPADD